MGFIPALLGVAGGIVGAVGANQQRQKNKGRISAAYRAGQTRLDLSQGDERQSASERLIARGLTGGGVTPLVPARPTQATITTDGTGQPIPGAGPLITKQFGLRQIPGDTLDVGGAQTLGQQYGRDLHREQALEQTDLRTGYDNALNDNNAAANNAELGAIAGGIGSAVNGYNAAKAYANLPDPRATPANAGPPKAMRDLSGESYGGINPVDPLASGAWAPTKSNSNFNVYGGRS